MAYPVWVFSTIDNWLRYISAKVCLFLFFFCIFELTQSKTPTSTELRINFQDCSLIKQLHLDLGRSEISCLASIRSLRFLKFYAKECLKFSKNQLRNNRKPVTLTNLLHNMQDLLELREMNHNYYQIDLSLNKPAR